VLHRLLISLLQIIKRLQCIDGIDNDNDGKIDYPKYPDCNFAEGYFEHPLGLSLYPNEFTVDLSGPLPSAQIFGIRRCQIPIGYPSPVICGFSAVLNKNYSYLVRGFTQNLNLNYEVEDWNVEYISIKGPSPSQTIFEKKLCTSSPVNCKLNSQTILQDGVYFIESKVNR